MLSVLILLSNLVLLYTISREKHVFVADGDITIILSCMEYIRQFGHLFSQNYKCILGLIHILKGVLNNFSHFGSARLFLFIFAYYIKHLLIYDIW